MINCRKATRLLSRAADAELPWIERALLRLHLAACDACTRFSQQLQFVRAALARYRE